MAEETTEKETGTEETAETTETQETETTEQDPVESLAREMGWNPNHDGSDGRERLSARDFIKKGREIQNTASKHIKKQSRELTEIKNVVENLTKHNQALYSAYKTHLNQQKADLESKRQQAVQDGDSAAATAIDAQIGEINKIPAELPNTGNTMHPEFAEWLDENGWYEDDNELRAYADMLGNQPEYRALAGRSRKAALDKVADSVKRMFPNKFNANVQPETKVATRTARAAVEPATRRAAQSKVKISYNDLSRDQQAFCDDFVRRGIMTQEQYIEQLEMQANAK